MTKLRLPEPLRLVLTCAALVVLYAAAPVEADTDRAQLVLRWILTIAMIVVVAITVSWQTVRQLRERDAPLGGLVIAVLAALLLFALVDYTIAFHRPEEFVGLETRIDAVYFALGTQLTVGFGDVTAQGQLARTVLIVQMAFNFTVIAGAASLVARKFATRARRADRRHGRSTP